MSKKVIAGLDIGSTKVTAVISTVEDAKAPQVIGVATQPSQGLKKGVIVNIDSAINCIATTLEAAERMAGVTVSSVYVTINGKHITSTNNKGVVAVSQEEIVREDVFRAIESARTVSIPPSREILHVIPREFIVDAQGGIKDPIGMSGTRLEVDAHIVSATTTAVQNLLKCIQNLGLRVDDVIFGGWASSSAVLTDTEKELGVLMLDIGGGTTSITAFIEDAITYSGCVAFGGTNVTSDIAIGLRVSLEDAEKIKLNLDQIRKNSMSHGRLSESKAEKILALKKKDDDEKNSDDEMLDLRFLNIPDVEKVSSKMIEGIIEARMGEIFDLVSTQLEQSGLTSKMPAGVVLTGGSALLPGLTAIAKKSFDVPARIAYPKGIEGLVDEISSPAFSASQGLILYGVNDDGSSPKSVKAAPEMKGGSSGGIFGSIKNFFKRFTP
ncbi:MAG: cell division protein FtsA [bacterium]